MNYENNKNWHEQEQQEKKRRAQKDFNFEKDLQSYIDTTFPIFDDDITRPIHEEYSTAVLNKNTKAIKELAKSIEQKISYLQEKSKGDEEAEQYVMKLELLKEKLAELL